MGDLHQLLAYWSSVWKNTAEDNERFHKRMTEVVDSDPWLKSHRDWVEQHQFGFGDRPFHAIWDMLVIAMPDEFSFLEIGVFKGQVLSLIGVLARKHHKQAQIYGVTTLQNTPDVRCKYPEGNYADWIKQIHDHFEVKQPQLIVGKSTDNAVLFQVDVLEPFDMVYIDGGHDYADAVADIKNYGLLTKVGGFLIVDDASINRLNVGSLWPGLEDVAQAVKDHLDNDPRFKFLFCCGHINVFRRVSE